MRDIGLPLLVTRLVLVIATLTASRWQVAVPDPGHYLTSTPRTVAGSYAGRWFNWDAAWYLRIAGNGPQMGYSRYVEDPKHHSFSAFAFFPLYPLLVRAVALAVPEALDAVPVGGVTRGGLLIVGLIVANLAFVLGLVALYLWAAARAGPGAARRVVWLLCLFPTTVFFSAPYSESLFFLWVALFFLCLVRRRWLLAGACGALASATRSIGVTLMLPYVVAVWQVYRQQTHARSGGEGADRWRQRPRLLWPVVLVPLGLLGYAAYLWLAWGNPLQFHDAEAAWGRSLHLPWVGIIDGLTWSLRKWPHLPQQNWRGLTDALYAVVFLALTAFAWRSLDWVERSYAVVFWLFPLSEPNITDPNYPDTLISMARFLLLLLPLWLWLARSRWRTWLMVVPSGLVLLFYAARWVNGAWIG